MKFTGPALKTKLVATGVHLSMSLVIFAFLAYQIYYHWYPEPYYSIDGGWQGMRLIAAVDLVLGPFITFLIFDLTKRRREIIFDLTVIVVIQISALTYGIVTTYSNRPLAIVLIDEFLISAVEEHYAGTLESVDILSNYSDENPPIIFAQLPPEINALKEAERKRVEEGVQEHAQIELYQPKESLKPALQRRQILFMQRFAEAGVLDEFRSWLAHSKYLPEAILTGRYQGRYGRAILIFDADGKYLTFFRSGKLEID